MSNTPPDRRILIVEDEELIAFSLAEYAKSQGWQVDTAHSCRGATDLLRGSDPYLLVLLDLRLPDGDGLSLAEIVHRRDPLTEIVIITGFGALDDAVHAIRAGVTDFITKPVTPEQFWAMLRRAETRAELRRGPEDARSARMIAMMEHMQDRLLDVEIELQRLKAKSWQTS